MRYTALRQAIAATLEYLSMLPSPQLLFEMIPLKRWVEPAPTGTVLQRLVHFFYNAPAWRLPRFIRMLFAMLNPDYDPDLKAWPTSVREYERMHNCATAGKRLRQLLARRAWLRAYAWFWASRRPATRKRLIKPLFYFFGGKQRPALATIGVFAWSGLLHAVWYPLLPLYPFLARLDLALYCFFGIWATYTTLGVPVAIYHHLRGRRLRNRKHRR
jgi:hypothetical protein